MIRKLLAAALAGAIALAPALAAAADQTPLKSVAATNGPTHPANFQTGDTVGVAHGGTSSTSFTAHCVLIGEGTAAVTVACPSTVNNVLTDNGASADPSFKPVAAGVDAWARAVLVKSFFGGL